MPWLARADGLGHDPGKLPCGSDRAPRSSRNKRCCNLLSKPFFAIVADNLPYFAFVRAGEPLGGSCAAARVHAHVERRIGAEAEAARRVVELRRRHAEIKQNAVDLRCSACDQHFAQTAEILVRELQSLVIDFSARCDRRRIAIQRNQTPAPAQARQNLSAVAAAAKRAVDVNTVRLHFQTVYCRM